MYVMSTHSRTMYLIGIKVWVAERWDDYLCSLVFDLVHALSYLLPGGGVGHIISVRGQQGWGPSVQPGHYVVDDWLILGTDLLLIS